MCLKRIPGTFFKNINYSKMRNMRFLNILFLLPNKTYNNFHKLFLMKTKDTATPDISFYLSYFYLTL